MSNWVIAWPFQGGRGAAQKRPGDHPVAHPGQE